MLLFIPGTFYYNRKVSLHCIEYNTINPEERPAVGSRPGSIMYCTIQYRLIATFMVIVSKV